MNFDYDVPDSIIPLDPRFNPGPSKVRTDYVLKLAKDSEKLLGRSHRSSWARNVVKEIQEGLLEYFECPKDYKVILGNGGATLFFDMVSLGLVRNKVTHFTCGEFSKKWFKSSKAIPWIEATEQSVPMGEGIDPVYVEGSDVICTTLNETSTGVQIASLPDLPSDCLLAMDATSGAGQIPVDMSKIDVFFFSAQKIFAAEGGLYAAILSPRAIARTLEICQTDRYIPPFMNFKTALDNGEKNQTYTTPSMAALYLFNLQLKEMKKLGHDAICSLAKEKAGLLYNWAQEKPYLRPFVQQVQYRSQSVATIDVDDKVDVKAIIQHFQDKGWADGIGSYRKLGRNQFRIGLFHNIELEDLKRLTELISFVIEKNYTFDS